MYILYIVLYVQCMPTCIYIVLHVQCMPIYIVLHVQCMPIYIVLYVYTCIELLEDSIYPASEAAHLSHEDRVCDTERSD